jgi:uroporphyrinogen decarboxylase
MQKRDVVKAVLDGRRPPYVPWSIGFTKKAAETLQLHYGADALENRVQNHFVKLGSDIGFFDELGDDRVRDVFGVVWNRSIDRDIGIVEGYVLPDATLTGFSTPEPS